MKALVMTAIFAVTSMINVAATTLSDGFAYNYAVNEQEQVTQQMVYKSEGKYLQHYLKYDFAYDDLGRMVKKEAYKWNETAGAYQPYYCLTYAYNGEDVTLEYAKWNAQDMAYTSAKERAVYNLTDEGLAYLAYDWNAELNGWQLTAEHRLEDNTVLLAAE